MLPRTICHRAAKPKRKFTMKLTMKVIVTEIIASFHMNPVRFISHANIFTLWCCCLLWFVSRIGHSLCDKCPHFGWIGCHRTRLSRELGRPDYAIIDACMHDYVSFTSYGTRLSSALSKTYSNLHFQVDQIALNTIEKNKSQKYA